jgi:hypothetical protein
LNVYFFFSAENILLHASGHMKLTDFDLSKQMPWKGNNLNGDDFKVQKGQPDTDMYVRNQRTNSFVGTEEYIGTYCIVFFRITLCSYSKHDD